MNWPMMGLRQEKCLAAFWMRRLSRNTRTIRRGRVPYFCRRIEEEPRFMLYGVSQKATINQWFWSLPIARILGGGINHLRGGGNDETAKESQVCT